MINFKIIVAVLFCFYLSSSLGSLSSAQQLFQSQQNRQPIFNGRIIQQRPTQTQQNQRRTIQNQPVQQRRTVQTRPVQQRRTVQTRPVQRTQPVQRVQPVQQGQPAQQFFSPRQTNQALTIQGRITQGRPVVQSVGVPTPAPRSAQQPADSMKLARAKIGELNNKIKNLQQQNASLPATTKKLKVAQEKIAELSESIKDLEVQNDKITSSTGDTKELEDDNDRLKTLVAELKEQLNNPSDDMSEKVVTLQKQLEQLVSENQTAVQQNETLSGQVKTLTGEVKALTEENADLKQQTGEMGDTKNLKTEPNAATTRVPELETKIQSLMTQKDNFSQQNEELARTNKQLKTEIGAMREQSETLQTQYETASKENENYLVSIDSLKSQIAKTEEVSLKVPEPIRKMSGARADAELENKNLQMTKLNADLENEIDSLKGQVSKLEGQIAQANTSEAAPITPVSGLTPVAAVATEEAAFSNMDDLYLWLVPSLAIGLAITLFGFLREDYPRAKKARKDV